MLVMDNFAKGTCPLRFLCELCDGEFNALGDKARRFVGPTRIQLFSNYTPEQIYGTEKAKEVRARFKVHHVNNNKFIPPLSRDLMVKFLIDCMTREFVEPSVITDMTLK
jgi:hypothetical protein